MMKKKKTKGRIPAVFLTGLLLCSTVLSGSTASLAAQGTDGAAFAIPTAAANETSVTDTSGVTASSEADTFDSPNPTIPSDEVDTSDSSNPAVPSDEADTSDSSNPTIPSDEPDFPDSSNSTDSSEEANTSNSSDTADSFATAIPSEEADASDTSDTAIPSEEADTSDSANTSAAEESQSSAVSRERAVQFSGMESAIDLPAGESIDLLYGIAAFLEDGSDLEVRVDDLTARGDPDFTYDDDRTQILSPAAGARYTAVYGAYDEEGERLAQGRKRFYIQEARVPSENAPRDEDYLFTFSGTGRGTVLPNTSFDCLRAVSLNVERRDAETAITEEEIANYEAVVLAITSDDPSYVFHTGDTSFVSGDRYGTGYTVTYGVRNDAADRLVEGVQAQKNIAVGKPTGLLPFLDNDDQYISDFSIKSIEDGTAPFDADDLPGNDSTGKNRLVRSYDSVSYTLSVTSEAYTAGAYYKSGYLRFRFVLPCAREKAQFDVTSMGWMTADTGGAYDWRITEETIDGRPSQVLTAAKYLDPEAAGQTNALPVIEQTVNVTILVAGMQNGERLQPTFYAWMDYNTTPDKQVSAKAKTEETEETREADGAEPAASLAEAKSAESAVQYNAETAVAGDWNDFTSVICPEHGQGEVRQAIPEAVTVSAAPRYNIRVECERDASGAAFDFNRGTPDAPNQGRGEVDGALFQYGIGLELLNTGDENKGLRGIELPQGEITFSVDLDTYYICGDDGRRYELDGDAQYAPLLWVAGGNQWTTSGSFGRDVTEFGYTLENVITYMPSNEGHNFNACDGGTWQVRQEGSRLYVTVSGYQIDPYDFPYQAAYGDRNSSKYYSRALYGKGPQYINTGIFSVGQFYIVAPYGRGDDYLASRYGAGSIYLSLTADNLHAVSVSGQETTRQEQTDGDHREDSYALRTPGNFDNYVQYTAALDPQKYPSLHPFYDVDGSTRKIGLGEDAAALGQRFTVTFGCSYNNRNESSLYGADTLVKFDSKAMRPVIDESVLSPWAENGADHTAGYTQGITHTTLYAAKKDGGHWRSDEEMARAGIGDMRYFATLDVLRASGAVCTGILQQARTDEPLPGLRYALSGVLFEAGTDSALAGGVYPIVACSNVYMGTAEQYRGKIPAVLDWQERGARMPEPTAADWSPTSYIKATWENGRYVGGDNTWTDNGDSLYLLPYQAQITKTIEQTAGRQSKSVFDLDNGQNIVDIRLTPSLVTFVGNAAGQTTTMTVTDVLPAGLFYNGDSTYGGTYAPSEKEGYHGAVTGGEALTPQISTDEEGRTHLTWTIADVPVTAELPPIRYSAAIDRTSAENNQYFAGEAAIETTEDRRDKETAAKNLSTAGFRVVKLSGLSISKEADHRFYNTGEDIGFSLNWQNFTKNDVSDVVMADTMPYGGDDAGSAFSGTYTVTELAVQAAEGLSLSDYAFYYTLDETMRGKTTRDFTAQEVRSGANGWTQAAIGGDGGVPELTGKSPAVWCVIGSLPSAKNVRAHVTLRPARAKAGDVYCNTISIKSSANTAKAAYLNRYLSGRTWLDENRDGVRQSNERPLPGVRVTLYQKGDRSAPVSSLDGVVCTSVTNRSGGYSFYNLPAGEFELVFSSSSGAALSRYVLTAQRAEGAPPERDSDAKPVLENGVLTQAVIDDLTMPAEGREDAVYFAVRDQDAGFYQAIEAVKEILDENGQDINEQVLGRGTTFTYRIRYKTETGGQVTVFDELPEGVAFVSSPDRVLAIRDEGDAAQYEQKYVPRGYAPLPQTYRPGRTLLAFLAKAGDDRWRSVSCTVQVEKETTVSRLVNRASVVVSSVGEEETNTVRNPLAVRPLKTVYNESGEEIGLSVVASGQTLTYHIAIENPTANTQRYTVTDELPPQLAFLSAQDGGVLENGVVRWQGTLAPHEKRTLSFTARILDTAADEEIANRALLQMGRAEEESEPARNFILPPPRKLVLDENGESMEGKIAAVGQELLYKIAFFNPSNMEKTAVIRDTLPPYLELLALSPGGVFEDDVVTFTVTAPPKTESYVTFRVRVLPEGQGEKIVNRAAVRIDEAELPTNESSFWVLPNPVKSVYDKEGKDLDGGVLPWNQEATFRIAYRNPSDSPQTVVITDELSSLLSGARLTAIGEGGARRGDALRWVIREAAPQEEGFVTFTVTANDTPLERLLENRAQVTVGGAQGLTNRVTVTVPANPSYGFVPEDDAPPQAMDAALLQPGKGSGASSGGEAAQAADRRIATGDDTALFFWGGVLTAAALGLAAVLMRLRCHPRA